MCLYHVIILFSQPLTSAAKHEILDSIWLYRSHLSPLRTCLVNAPPSAGCPVAPGWGAQVGFPTVRSGGPHRGRGRGGTGKVEAAAGRDKRWDVATVALSVLDMRNTMNAGGNGLQLRELELSGFYFLKGKWLLKSICWRRKAQASMKPVSASWEMRVSRATGLLFCDFGQAIYPISINQPFPLSFTVARLT